MKITITFTLNKGQYNEYESIIEPMLQDLDSIGIEDVEVKEEE